MNGSQKFESSIFFTNKNIDRFSHLSYQAAQFYHYHVLPGEFMSGEDQSSGCSSTSVTYPSSL